MRGYFRRIQTPVPFSRLSRQAIQIQRDGLAAPISTSEFGFNRCHRLRTAHPEVLQTRSCRRALWALRYVRLNDLFAIALGIGSTSSTQAALDRTTLMICYVDSRELGSVASGSVQLALTSAPYWTLKECRVSSGSASHSTRLVHFFLRRKTKWSSPVGWL